MEDIPKDIYTEPRTETNTLENLGPLKPMAGIFEGTKGFDTNPKAKGPEYNDYTEKYENILIDRQLNGPQLYYGLRYNQTAINPEEKPVFHNQIGYWLWEPATNTIIQTLAIPRAQIAMAVATVEPDATEFEVKATRGTTEFGICSAPFLEKAFKTLEYRCRITIHSEDSWSYEYTTVLVPADKGEPFEHTDINTLKRVADSPPNPLYKNYPNGY